MKTYFLYRRKYGKRRYESEACCEVVASSLNEAKKRFVQQGFTGGFMIRGRRKDGEPFACNYTVTLRESEEKERRNMKIQIDKLDAMLKEAGIPFERSDGRRQLDEEMVMKIYYPTSSLNDCIYAVLQTRDKDILTVGSLIGGACSLEGWLTAEEVFERIKKHWDAMEVIDDGKTDNRGL